MDISVYLEKLTFKRHPVACLLTIGKKLLGLVGPCFFQIDYNHDPHGTHFGVHGDPVFGVHHHKAICRVSCEAA